MDTPTEPRAAPLITTVIGSFPKPEYLEGVVVDWFTESSHDSASATRVTTNKRKRAEGDPSSPDVERLLRKASKEVLQEQTRMGVMVPTDGEVRRENYIHNLCRFIDGISFDELTRTGCRPHTVTGEFAYYTSLPTVVGPVRWRGGLDIGEEWKGNQEMTDRAVKYTLPGPMTMIGTLANQHYASDQELGADLALILRERVAELVRAGCTNIQIDEPLFARQLEKAIEWGIPLLDQILDEVPVHVNTTVHICCGYPTHIDQTDYLKADPCAYQMLAPALDDSKVNAVSLEDAHRPNDLSTLLPMFKKKIVVLGCVTVACSKVESQLQIEARLNEALKYIDRERLQVAPDCGLGFLQGKYRPLLDQKLTNMCAAAGNV